jgi:hypothetical protein
MVERSAQQMTLREMLSEAERLTRELGEHLDQSFIPKCHELSRLLRPINGEPPDLRAIEDVTVRTQTARILETENFTESLFERLAEYSRTIDEAVGRITTEG